jgi:phospholipid-binding lipoprotein MlaA
MRGNIALITLAAALAGPALAHAQEAPEVIEAPATAQVEPAQAEPVAAPSAGDPWQGFNRSMFAVHEGVDQAVLEPVARGYRAVTPSPLRSGVRNFLRNLRGPVIFANDVLQGEAERGATTAARFVLNTTIGIAGVFDPAASMGLEYHDEDFGQTLAVWGVGAGPYLFVPLMGPSNVRDTTGRIIDSVLDPLSYLEGDDAGAFRATRGVLTGVSVREQLLETVDDVRRDSLDPYSTFRSSYELLRESAIQNGRTDVQDLPDFDENLESDDPGQPDSGEYSQHSASNETPVTANLLDASETKPTSHATTGEKK